MTHGPFQFQLQAALEQAMIQRDVCTAELEELRAEVEAARERLRELARLREAAQRRRLLEEAELHGASLNLGGGAFTAEDLVEGARFMERLRRDAKEAALAEDSQRERLAGLERGVEEKERELAERMDRVRGFERLKERGVAEHEAERRRLEGLEADEAALEQFQRRGRDREG